MWITPSLAWGPSPRMPAVSPLPTCHIVSLGGIIAEITDLGKKNFWKNFWENLVFIKNTNYETFIK